MPDDVVDPGNGFFLIGDIDPPEAGGHGIGFPLLQKDPRCPFAQGTQDLITDGFDPVRNLIGGDHFFALPAQDHHLVTDLAIRNMTDIDGTHVHGNPSHDGSPFPPDDDLALIREKHPVAIAIADGDRRDPGRLVGHVGPVIADTVTFREFFDQNDSCLETHDRGEVCLASGFRGWIDAIGHDARANHVQMELRVIEDGPAVGHVSDGNPDFMGLQFIQQLFEQMPLPVVIFNGHLTGRQVGKDPFDDDIWKFKDFPDHVKGFIMDRAAAAHPGIDFDVNRCLDARFLKAFLQLPGKTDVGDRWDQVVLDDLTDFIIRRGTQNDNRRRDITDPELHALIGVGDTETGCAVFQCYMSDFHRAMAVSIGFHHLHDLNGGTHQTLHLIPVAGKVIQVDFYPASISLFLFCCHESCLS